MGEQNVGVIELTCGDATCMVDPASGGRVATLRAGDTDLLIGPDPAWSTLQWGAYPMVPWAGRVRRGAFTFDGIDQHLPINFEHHAIHGTGFEQSWNVVDATQTRAVLRCDLAWVLGGSAEHIVELGPRQLTCTLAATAGERPMPAVIGWHPWFVKPQQVDLRFMRMYARDDDYITDGTIVSPPPPPPWDDCFAGPLSPPRLWIGDLTVTLASDCDFWVVFDMPAHATCVEPQSGLPDAFNLPADVGGAARLSPGEELRRTMRVSWERAGA